MPPGALVPRDWLLEQLSGASPDAVASAAASTAVVDLTIADLAGLFHKRPSTVRAWVERGDFPGAYKLYGKEWRVPMSAVEAFQDRQRRGAVPSSRLSAWRSVAQTRATTRRESGQQLATKRSPRGNAEV